jgi:hypothetical protein
MSEQEELTHAEALRMVAYLRGEVERQRAVNGEMRRAVAELAREFQASLARSHEAAQSGDLDRVRQVVIENREAWQEYLQQIIAAASRRSE